MKIWQILRRRLNIKISSKRELLVKLGAFNPFVVPDTVLEKYKLRKCSPIIEDHNFPNIVDVDGFVIICRLSDIKYVPLHRQVMGPNYFDLLFG